VLALRELLGFGERRIGLAFVGRDDLDLAARDRAVNRLQVDVEAVKVVLSNELIVPRMGLEYFLWLSRPFVATLNGMAQFSPAFANWQQFSPRLAARIAAISASIGTGLAQGRQLDRHLPTAPSPAGEKRTRKAISAKIRRTNRSDRGLLRIPGLRLQTLSDR